MSIVLLEYHLTNHCNLNCKGCAHFAPLAKPWYANIDNFKQDLRQLSQIIEIEHLRLFGGEPLLHKNIGEFCVEARKILPNAKISILSNGILFLKNVSSLIPILKHNNIVMEFTKYPHTNVNFNMIQSFLSATKIEYHIECLEADKMLRKHILSETPQENNHKCIMMDSCSTQLYQGKLYSCPIQAYCHIFDEYFNQHYADKVPNIDVYHTTENEIMNFINRKNSFCEYCREPIYHLPYQISKKQITEWTDNNA